MKEKPMIKIDIIAGAGVGKTALGCFIAKKLIESGVKDVRIKDNDIDWSNSSDSMLSPYAYIDRFSDIAEHLRIDIETKNSNKEAFFSDPNPYRGTGRTNRMFDKLLDSLIFN